MTPEAQLDAFIDKYTDEVATLARAVLAKMRKLTPGANEMVYDNYNALVIGFSPTERPSDAILSIGLYPRYLNLFFLQGASLPDPDGILKGEGRVVRRINLNKVEDLDPPEVQDMIFEALRRAKAPLVPESPRRLTIKSISAKQRPRRPE